jgi:holo-[acyl-carrier protein] synthase
MVVGIGIDVVETARLSRALSTHGWRFEDQVFTPNELADSANRRDRTQALAGRFAAKEACLKALCTGLFDGVSLRQAEVVSGDAGAPRLRLTGALAERARLRGVRSVYVSLTHERGVAAAVVVLEG